MALSYIKQLRIFISTITACISVSEIALLVGVPIGITSSAVRLNVSTIIAVIKN